MANITQPTKVTITPNWDMQNERNLNTNQPKVILLDFMNGQFKAPKAPNGKHQFYTSLNQKDDTHTMTLDVIGAKVTINGITQELCGKENIRIEIKGDMYDDVRAN